MRNLYHILIMVINIQSHQTKFLPIMTINTCTIDNINKFVLGYIDKVVQYISSKVFISDVLYMAYELIEQNKYLIKYIYINE